MQVKLPAKDMEEQLKLTHKFEEVVDRPHRKFFVTLLRYIVEKLETSHVQVRFFGRNKEDKNSIDLFMWTINSMNLFVHLMWRYLYMIKLLLKNFFVMFCNK